MKFQIIICFVIFAAPEMAAKCPERAVGPVCASDKNIYANRCLAKEKGLKIVCWDQCSCKRGCTEEYAPVCGSNGGIYSNRCELLTASCKTKGKLREAPKARCCKCPNCDKNPPCKRFCDRNAEDDKTHDCSSKCKKDSKPVCYNGLVYDNQCLRDCENPSSDGGCDKPDEKPCDDDCPDVCPLYVDPVCGGYGKKYEIYSNRCFLGIAACHDKRIHEVDISKCDTRCPENINP